MWNQSAQAPEGNVFLSSLSSVVRKQILSNAEHVPLLVHDTLLERGEAVVDVYFPVEGAISNVVQMDDGSAIEVGLIGREGLFGYPSAVSGGTSVGTLYPQIAGSAIKMSGLALDDVLRSNVRASQSFLRYVDAQLGGSALFGACNAMHTIHERFSRWLLLAHDRALGDEITLTQESLAVMLGVHRPGVSVAAAALKKSRTIDYSRGNIVVVDRNALQRSACGCYDEAEDRFEQRTGYSIRKYRLGAR